MHALPRRLLSPLAPIILSIVLGPALAWGAPMTTGFTGIEARYATNEVRTRTITDPASRAIDNNLSTDTYITSSFTLGAVYIYLDLGSPTHIEGLRVHKLTNEYGPHTVAIDYSTGAGPTNMRSYSTISNLTAGYQGTELPSFTLAGGIVGNALVQENGAAVSPYVYSATFDGINNATSLRLTLSNQGGNTHLRVTELQAIVPEPTTAAMIIGLIPLALRGRRRAAR